MAVMAAKSGVCSPPKTSRPSHHAIPAASADSSVSLKPVFQLSANLAIIAGSTQNVFPFAGRKAYQHAVSVIGFH